MADDEKTAAEDKPKTAPRKAAAKKDEPRESMVNDKVNMVDGKPEKIADGRTSTEAVEVGQDDPEYAPTPWRETNDKLDNRVGDQQVDDAAWASKPQHVNGGEVSDKAKLDNRA